MDHVLKFVRQHAVGKFLVQVDVVGIEHEHFMSIGIRVGERVQLIGGGKVPGQVASPFRWHKRCRGAGRHPPGRPFAAEEFAVGGVVSCSNVSTRLSRSSHVKLDAVFDPEVNVIGFILQCRFNLEVLGGIYVGVPEVPAVAHIIGSRVFSYVRGISGMLLSLRQFTRVVVGNHGLLQGFKRGKNALIRRESGDHPTAWGWAAAPTRTGWAGERDIGGINNGAIILNDEISQRTYCSRCAAANEQYANNGDNNPGSF